MIKAMQRGEDFEVDAAEDDEEEEKRLQQTFLGRLLGKRANVLRVETVYIGQPSLTLSTTSPGPYCFIQTPKSQTPNHKP